MSTTKNPSVCINLSTHLRYAQGSVIVTPNVNGDPLVKLVDIDWKNEDEISVLATALQEATEIIRAHKEEYFDNEEEDEE